jgi:hypothetical protein
MEDIFNTLANITKPCSIPVVRHSNDLKINTIPIIGWLG